MVIKGHFDGRVVVLDEPVTLAVGQRVEVVIQQQAVESNRGDRRSLAGFAKGLFEMGADFNEPLPEFSDYQ
jgi:hypothetical protein